MPLDARSVTMAESPPTLSPEAKAQVHHAAIDAILSKPWSKWELEDSDNGGDHDRRTAGRFYTPDRHRSATGCPRRGLREASWRSDRHGDPGLLIAPRGEDRQSVNSPFNTS